MDFSKIDHDSTYTQGGRMVGIDDRRNVRERHLFVSNRSPYFYQESGHALKTSKAIGGLVSTMEPAFRKLGGLWIGSANGSHGKTHEILPSVGSVQCFCKHVNLTDEEIGLYYNGFANSALWPLCHTFLDRFKFRENEWLAYRRVNRKFACAISEELTSTDTVVWIHDYHLSLTPEFVRRRYPSLKIASYWHIPFPGPEYFSLLPTAADILAGLLRSSFIGFHLQRYAKNFIECVRMTLPEASVDEKNMQIHAGGHTTRIAAVPLGIDFQHWDQESRSPAVIQAAARLRARINADTVALSVDRLDYTKGIFERLKGFEHFLEHNPSMLGRISLLQIGVPTRVGIKAYRLYQTNIEREIRRINSRFGQGSWKPVIFKKGLVPQDELAIWYRLADVAVITPICDGMNLVAKEFVASRGDLAAALVLGRKAGVAEELGDSAILVDPQDPGDMTAALERALSMQPDETAERMRSMRSRVRRQDLSWWLKSIAQHLDFADVGDLPLSD